MENAHGPLVVDVTQETFEELVIERSHKVPVLVDFWAAWCGPCRMLGPVLESLAKDMGGRFVLAKLDTEANQSLAAAFRISGIPACKLFYRGKLVDEFTGALPESAVRAFIDKNCPSEADELLAAAQAALRSGDPGSAREGVEQALALGGRQPGAQLLLAELALLDGDSDAVEQHIRGILAGDDEYDAAQRLREALGLARTCREAGGLDACRAAAAATPDDLDARFAYAACLAVSGSHREALDELLAVFDRDRTHNDRAAHKAILTIFALVGPRSELANEYRDKLAILL